MYRDFFSPKSLYCLLVIVDDCWLLAFGANIQQQQHYVILKNNNNDGDDDDNDDTDDNNNNMLIIKKVLSWLGSKSQTD